ncbi:hypothetical protein KUTeg_022374 [Tegillarca granosa]|uniref:Chitin-binding type-2 domain-containing protein n=1 Tax=Tegillarca granosa TaxID=220873 RepID=A0ABQ9EBL7_TEGGR|nr:hypothetical protein KUTeg_022374 [Tegillarca granosa]
MTTSALSRATLPIQQVLTTLMSSLSTKLSTKQQTTSVSTPKTTKRITTTPTTKATKPTTSTSNSTASQTQVLPNICVKGMPASFPHPFIKQQYFSCDVSGQMTLHTCPMTHIFCMEKQMCSLSCRSTAPVTSQMLQNCVTSPCIHGNSGYFPACNESCYIYCEYIDKSQLRCCMENEIWSSDIKTCIKKYLQYDNHTEDKTVDNPCIIHHFNQFFPFPGNNQKYIHCTNIGTGKIKRCPSGTSWHQDLISCRPV